MPFRGGCLYTLVPEARIWDFHYICSFSMMMRSLELCSTFFCGQLVATNIAQRKELRFDVTFSHIYSW